MLRIFAYDIRNRSPNTFLNPIQVWQNYLIYWIEVSRNFYENAVRTNEQWLKALWDPWLKPENSQVKNGGS
jgi:hypothetical protein